MMLAVVEVTKLLFVAPINYFKRTGLDFFGCLSQYLMYFSLRKA